MTHVDLSDLKLNARQRHFVLNLFAGMTQYQAYLAAGYHTTDRDVAEACACRLANIAKVSQALNRLHAPAEALAVQNTLNNVESVATPQEVKEVLSGILRGNIFDHLTDDGDVKPDKRKSTAIKEYARRHRIDHDGNPIITKELKLESKLDAARELAKIHGMYAPSKHLVAQRVQFEVIHSTKDKHSDT